MPEERCARFGSRFVRRALKSLLLALALLCVAAPPQAGRAGARRPNVAAAGQFGVVGGVELIAFESGGEIYVMDAGGGIPRRIVSRKSGAVVNMQPALSPDGSRVAFSSNLEGQFRIYVVGVDGRGMRRLTHSSYDDSEPAWSPDGSRIAFVRGFDATGNGVFVQTCTEWSDILVVDVDADPHTLVNLTNGSGGTDPAWSPDGKRIAFASAREGSFDIYMMSAEDGGEVKQLTQNDWADADPAWSPDGSYIAYTTRLRTLGGTQCGNMPISGSPTGGGGPHLSDESPRIYKLSLLLKAAPQEAVTTEGSAAGPSWSPDGTRIVFAGALKESDEVQLHSVAAGVVGAEWMQLTSDPLQKSSPSWSRTLGR